MKRSVMKFESLTPLEYLALADRERIHTETLRWLLGPDSTLPMDSRRRILERLIGVDIGPLEIVDSSSEVKHIDLLVKLAGPGGPGVAAFENKLKSGEHSAQLARYDVYLESFDPCFRVFLTLLGEPARSSQAWITRSYTDLLAAIEPEIGAQSDSSTYLAEYCAGLARLVEAVRLVTEEPDDYAGFGVVFPDELGRRPPTDFAEYVAKFRLRMILQKAWMRALGIAVGESMGNDALLWEVGEQRGIALVDFLFGEVVIDDNRFKCGIQLQGWRVKVFAAPEPYPKLATTAQHNGVAEILEALRSHLGTELKLTTPGSRGFRSCITSVPSAAGTFLIDSWASALVPMIRATREALAASAMPTRAFES